MNKFFTILLSRDENDTITKLIRDKEKEVEIFHLNQNKSEITKDSIFLICIGGDSGKSESWWLKDNNDIHTRGFKFIASILEMPSQYDPNDEKNYKIKIKIEYTFEDAIQKDKFIYWPDSYDTDASLATKGKQTQAIALLKDNQKYFALLRGAMFYHPEVEKYYLKKFGNEFTDAIKQPMKRFIEKNISYAEEQDLNNSITNFRDISKITYSYNRIVFGAPGTGKSYNLNKQ